LREINLHFQRNSPSSWFVSTTIEIVAKIVAVRPITKALKDLSLEKKSSKKIYFNII